MRGADKEHLTERPVLSEAEVVALADAVPARYRAMILLTTFASLRFGEVTALQRSDIDLSTGTVQVRRQFVEVRGEGLVAGPPKSQAGRRTVSIPPSVARSGVSTQDLMARTGHDSVRAAIIYQYATAEADARIAQALEVELSAADDADDDGSSAAGPGPGDGVSV